MILDGARFRREWDVQLAVLAAWHVAALARQRKLPRLGALLRPRAPAAPSKRQTPEQQLQMILLHHALLGGRTV